MEGDEYLSEGAQTYTKFYGQEWEAEKVRYDECVANGDTVGAEIAQINMDKLHSQAEDIKRLDALGLVRGRTLNVPIYNQLNTEPRDSSNNLCWATCIAMTISYYLGDTIDRTKSIAAYTRANIVWFEGNPIIYNHTMDWVSTDKYYLGLKQSQDYANGQITMAEIETTIDNGDPFAVLYGNYDQQNIWSGHFVEGIGYASAPGHDSLVVSNDPWGGIQRIQTFDEFAGDYVGDNTPWRPWVNTIIPS